MSTSLSVSAAGFAANGFLALPVEARASADDVEPLE
jgi:hypothetical protein